jgi:hypothetical protein
MTPGQLVERALSLSQSVETWADLSNALFNPIDGLVTLAYPTREARDAFRKSSEYIAIRQILNAAIERTGLIDGASPKKVKVLLDATPNGH